MSEYLPDTEIDGVGLYAFRVLNVCTQGALQKIATDLPAVASKLIRDQAPVLKSYFSEE